MAERIQLVGVKSEDGRVQIPLQDSDGTWYISDQEGTCYYNGPEDLRKYADKIKNDPQYLCILEDEPDLIQTYELLAEIMEEPKSQIVNTHAHGEYDFSLPMDGDPNCPNCRGFGYLFVLEGNVSKPGGPCHCSKNQHPHEHKLNFNT